MVSHDETTGACYGTAAGREKSDWYRIIHQNSSVGVQLRNHKFQANAEQIPTQEAEERLWNYARKYPTAFGELVTVMRGERLPPDKEACRKVAESVPLISLTPIG